MNIFKQKATNKTRFSMIYGGITHTYAQILIPISMVSNSMIAGMFYNTVIKVTPALAWIELWMYAIFAIIFVITASIIAWLITIPHITAYNNYISYRHGNLIVKEIQDVKEEIITELKKELSENNVKTK